MQEQDHRSSPTSGFGEIDELARTAKKVERSDIPDQSGFEFGNSLFPTATVIVNGDAQFL